MINSKAIKSSFLGGDKKEPTTRIGRAAAAVLSVLKTYIYYPFDKYFSRYKERTLRSLAFAKRGWLHYDFESAYIYDLMAFKMKRIYEVLENGHTVQDKKDMAALKEAIKICERLFKGNYDDKYHRAHDKKWGSLRSKTIPEYDDNGKIKHYRWESSRGKAKTEAQQKQEREEFRKTWEDGELDRIKDLDRLNEILKKHEPSWWD